MGAFSADWLALRAPADDRARSQELIQSAVAWLQTSHDPADRLTIADLGAGSGATVRALAAALHKAGFIDQRWVLMDADAALLARAKTELTGLVPGLTLEPVEIDLAATPTGWPTAPDLVTCSAFFDLVSQEWVNHFTADLAAARLPLLAFLTYSGTLTLEPVQPQDAAMARAFNAHQRTDKGFGPALGPDAADAVTRTLATQGYAVEQRPSDWELTRLCDGAVIDAVLDGWAEAALELDLSGAAGPEDRLYDAEIKVWRAAHGNAEELRVGHLDLWAVAA